jgi:hypothetical protein
VALVAVSVLSYHRDEPSVREQRTIAQAAPVVDRAAGELVAAAMGTTAAIEISGRRLTTGCRLTAAWAGAELERAVTLRTTEANAPALLDRIADGLPAGYRAAVRHADLGDVHRLRADAGEFVAITGGVTSPGVVSLGVRTGCRPPSPGFDPDGDEPLDIATGMARLNLLYLRADGVEVTDVTLVPCPGGVGYFVGQTATGRGYGLGPLRRQVARRFRIVIDEPDHLAFIGGIDSVGVRAEDGLLTATSVEARCPPWIRPQ